MQIHREQVFVALGIAKFDKVAPLVKTPIGPLDVVLPQLIGFGAGQQQRRDVLLRDRAARAQDRVFDGQPRQLLAFRECVELMQARPAVEFDGLIQKVGEQNPLPREHHAAVQGFAGEFCRMDIPKLIGAADGFNGRDGVAGRAQRA